MLVCFAYNTPLTNLFPNKFGFRKPMAKKAPFQYGAFDHFEQD